MTKMTKYDADTLIKMRTQHEIVDNNRSYVYWR